MPLLTLTSFKLVAVFGDSQWRSMVQGHVPIIEDAFRMGVSCTPGALVRDIHQVCTIYIFSFHIYFSFKNHPQLIRDSHGVTANLSI